MKRILGITTLGIILIILLVLLLFGGLPGVFATHSYGYWPSGLVAVLVVVAIVLIARDRL